MSVICVCFVCGSQWFVCVPRIPLPESARLAGCDEEQGAELRESVPPDFVFPLEEVVGRKGVAGVGARVAGLGWLCVHVLSDLHVLSMICACVFMIFVCPCFGSLCVYP